MNRDDVPHDKFPSIFEVKVAFSFASEFFIVEALKEVSFPIF